LVYFGVNLKMNLKKNKSPDTKKHQGLKVIFKDWAYLSGWIANLGVVPLLLFAAFLFLPAFVFLRALLFFVTRVFETILILLQRIQLCELRRIKYLPRMLTSVKALALGILLVSSAHAQDGSNPIKKQSLILSIGEVKELHLPKLERFTIGNNDSLSHKFYQKRKSLLLKGKKLGLSELHVWKQNGEHLIYQIYILSKANQLKLLSLTESILNMGLNVQNKGPWLLLSGELERVTHYNQLLKILRANKEKLQLQISLSPVLKRRLLSEVIKALFDDHISDFKCLFKNIEFICHLSDGRSPSPELKNYLESKYAVKFIKHRAQHRENNYRLKIKIIQLESTEAEVAGFGLNQLSGSLKGIFDKGWQTLYEQNKVLLKDHGVEAGLLAEPVMLARPNKKMMIQVGSEIPYQSTSTEGQTTTDFKFAGLRLKLLLEKEGDGFLLNYTAEITKPGSSGEISGSKESASARISADIPIELFEISFQTDALNKESLPLANKVPLFGRLFSNNQQSKSYKKITGLVFMEKI